jgi:hypothetical protein
MIFEVPVGADVWPTEMFETLMIALIPSLLNRFPWTIRGTRMVAEFEADLSRVWSPRGEKEGCRLRKFWTQAKSLEGMTERMASSLL